MRLSYQLVWLDARPRFVRGLELSNIALTVEPTRLKLYTTVNASSIARQTSSRPFLVVAE